MLNIALPYTSRTPPCCEGGAVKVQRVCDIIIHQHVDFVKTARWVCVYSDWIQQF